MVLDHNRMLIDAEIMRKDGSWRDVRLWVDSGNPDFFISEPLARDLGLDLSSMRSPEDTRVQSIDIDPPEHVRIGRMPLSFKGVKSTVMIQPEWLFSTIQNDANLPSTVLKKYHVVLDYPGLKFTIAQPGSVKPRGVRLPAGIHPETGIVQIDAVIGGDSLSFAFDNGASYSFASKGLIARLAGENPGWPTSTGAVGCANIWGWWPEEPTWPVLRIPELYLGSVRLAGVGFTGVPDFFPGGQDLGGWYSYKTASPVAGFLGPNAFKAFRIEIDYTRSAVFLEKKAEFELHDMDLVGLTLRPEADGGFRVIGIARHDGKTVVDGVEPDDRLVRVDELEVQGLTMGAVVDALRGKPGDVHTLMLERAGRRFQVVVRVERIL